jgi:hypothetical protein
VRDGHMMSWKDTVVFVLALVAAITVLALAWPKA